MCRPALSLGLLILLLPGAQAELPSWQAVRTGAPPVIDGNLEDACWQEQTRVDNFRDVRTGEPARAQTRFMALYDDAYLYLAIICEDPSAGSLRAQFSGRDDPLWTDDCVELFIDPANRRQEYAHLIINPNGAVYDAWMSEGGAKTYMDYDSGAEVGTSRDEAAWVVELRIPFAGLRLPRGVTGNWAFNICRDKKTDPTERSCWSSPLADGFHHPERFGMLGGMKVDFRPHLVTVDRPQFLLPHYEEGQLVGSLRIPYSNWTGRDTAVRISVVFSDLEGNRAETVANGLLKRGQGALNVPVTVGHPGFADLQLEVWARTAEKLIHRSRHPMMLDYPPVAITILKPAYRETIFATLPSTEIVCNLKVHVLPKDLVGCELRVTFNSGPAELSVRRVRPDRQGQAQASFSSDIVPAGDYLLRAQAIRAGHVIAEGTKPIRKVRPFAHEVVVDHQGRLRVEGRTFFPWGFMGAAPDERLARAGFNTIHTYNAWYIHRDQNLTAWLDQAQDLGLKVVITPYPGEHDSFGFRGKPTVTDRDLQDIRSFVDQYRAHPALLAWQLGDEPRGAVWRATLRRVYETVADADPYHPCVILDNRPESLAELASCADILWIDPYPGFSRATGPRQPLTMVAATLRGLRERIGPGRPVWLAPQAFSFGEWDPTQAATEREPTVTEARCMNYLGLLNGADGIVPYAWEYAQKHPASRMAYLDNLGPEMAILLPAMLEGTQVRGVAAQPLSTGAQVQVRAWAWQGALYIVAVNPKPEEARARLVVPGLRGRWVKALAENRRLQALRDTLTDVFAPCAVHVYSDQKKLPWLRPLEDIEDLVRGEEALTARNGRQ